MSSLVFICDPVKSKMGACGVCSIHEWRQTSSGCNGSASKKVKRPPAWSVLGLLLFVPWGQTTILEGSLLVK